jgi:multiple sugar transport system substrate-binding protein
MSKKKILTGIFASVIALSVVLSACSSGSPTAPTTQPSSSSQTEKKAEPVEIRVAYMDSGTYNKAAEETADLVKDQGLTVTVDAFPWAVMRQNEITDIISGTGTYDVHSGAYYMADVFSQYRPLEEFLSKKDVTKGMIPSIVQNGAEYYEGKMIGIPFGPDAYGLMYRVDLFEKIGLKPPQTWPEFLEALKKLQDAYGAEGIAPYVFAGGAVEQNPVFLFHRYDGHWMTRDNKYSLDKAKAIEALKVSQETLKYGVPNTMGLSIDEANNVFLSGNAAILEGWPSFFRAAGNDPSKSQVVGKWAIMEYPKPGRVWLSLWNLFIPQHTKKPDAAWQWVQSYINPERDKINFEKYGIGPIYESTFNDPAIKSKYGHDLDGLLANLKRSADPPLNGDAQDFMAQAIQEMMVGQSTPEQTVDKILAKWATMTPPQVMIDMAGRYPGMTQQ